MPSLRPPFLWQDEDRHGSKRLYVKRKGFPKIRIRPDPDREPEDFWKAYQLALEGRTFEKEDPVHLLEIAASGTFRWLFELWKDSPECGALNEDTRYRRQLLLEQCCQEPVTPGSVHLFGQTPIAKITSGAIRMLRDRKRDVPDAANNRLKALRSLFKWTLEHEDLCRKHGLAHNPSRDIGRLRSLNRDGFHTWTLEEVEQYEAHHGRGTMARLALDLFLYTGQRLSDVVQFGRQHLRRTRNEDGQPQTLLVFTQHKNRQRKPVKLELPVLPVLQSAIDAGPSGNLSFLVTEHGKPFTANGFGNKVRKWCDQAGLRHCTAHGLRKAAAVFVAEAGATDAQMMAIFGWNDPSMPALYRKMANQRKLAAASMHHLVPKRRKQAETAETPLLEWAKKVGAPPEAPEGAMKAK